MRCFVVSDWGATGRIVVESGVAGKVVDGLWCKVGNQTYNRINVIKDTARNRELWKNHVRAMREWKQNEPNVYAVLNQIEKE